MLGVQALGPVSPRRVAEAEPPRVTSTAAESQCGADAMREVDAQRGAERDAWVTLLAVAGLGPITFGALLAAFGSAKAVLEAAASPIGPDLLREALADQALTATRAGGEVRSSKETRQPSIGSDLASRICDGVADGCRAVERVHSLGLTVVTLEEPTYPTRLRLADLPPPILYVRGSVEAMAADHVVAIVGTRWPTDKGRLIAGWIGSAVARAGAVVVSGLAVGIDGAAHAAVVPRAYAPWRFSGAGTLTCSHALTSVSPTQSPLPEARSFRSCCRTQARVEAPFRVAIALSVECRTLRSWSKPAVAAAPSLPPAGRWNRVGSCLLYT